MGIHMRRYPRTRRIILRRELIGKIFLHRQTVQKIHNVLWNRREVGLRGAKGGVVEVVSKVLADASLAVQSGVDRMEGGDHGGFLIGGYEVVDEHEPNFGPSLDFGVVWIRDWGGD